ncbi:MAG: carboxypeptidase regulatory-like domain-containing protein [Myxococcota bacterium]
MHTLRFAPIAIVILAACPEKKAEPPPAPPAPVAVKPPEPVPAEPDAGGQPGMVAAVAGGTGSIEGVVSLEGKAPAMELLKRSADPYCAKTPMKEETVLAQDGKLKNVLVRIKEKVAGKLPDSPVVIDQLECMYRPRVSGAMKGQQLQIKNSNGTLHNVHTYVEGTKTWFNQAQPPKSKDIVKPIDKDGVVKLKCDVHPWMTGYVVVSEHPYFAVTGADGKFKLENVPAGSYTLEAWHEKLGTQTASVTVKAQEAVSASFAFQVK